ncbi:MAG: hypothetical protein ACRC2I_11125 [Plesiomonas shigelloides]
MKHELGNFTVELTPENPDSPMSIVSGVMTLTLPSTAKIYVTPITQGADLNTVLIKMNGQTNSTPEVSLYMTDSEVNTLEQISPLPLFK